jgi:hypothetical protein
MYLEFVFARNSLAVLELAEDFTQEIQESGICVEMILARFFGVM